MLSFSNQKTEFEKFANFSNYFLSNRTNFELKIIEFFELFLPFLINRIVNFRIESNEFRTNSNLTPPLFSTFILKNYVPHAFNYFWKIKFWWKASNLYPDFRPNCRLSQNAQKFEMSSEIILWSFIVKSPILACMSGELNSWFKCVKLITFG